MRLPCLLCVLTAFLLAPLLPATPVLASEDFEGESAEGNADQPSDTGFDMPAVEEETSVGKELKLSFGLDFGAFVPLKTKKRMYPSDYASVGLLGMMPLDLKIGGDKVSLLLMLDISYYESRTPMTQWRDHLDYHLFMPAAGVGFDVLPSFNVMKFLPYLKIGFAYEHEHGQRVDWTSPTGYRSYNRQRLGIMMKFGLCYIFQPLTHVGVMLGGEMISNFGGRNLMYAYEVSFGVLVSL